MILPSDDSRLNEECVPFDFDNGYKTDDGYVLNAKEMFESLREEMMKNKGVGLSACQLGHMTQVFVFGDYMTKDAIVPVFNPMIIDYSEEQVTYEEACISFPGMFIKVKRPRSIRVRYAGIDGDINTAKYDGYSARVFQHEYDHLHGIVFTKRANRYHLEKARKFKAKIDRQLRFVA